MLHIYKLEENILHNDLKDKIDTSLFEPFTPFNRTIFFESNMSE